MLFNTAGIAGGSVRHSPWIGFLFGMILPAYAISSFDATGNAAEETKNAARNAALGTVLANTIAVLGGGIMFYLLMRAIPNVDTMMASSTPVKYILESTVGTTITTIFEATAIVALMACIAMLQLTAVRVIWSQARDRQMPRPTWLHKLSRNQIPTNATFVVLVLSIGVCLWSSLLSVLSAMTALAWALGLRRGRRRRLRCRDPQEVARPPLQPEGRLAVSCSASRSSGRSSCAPCWCGRIGSGSGFGMLAAIIFRLHHLCHDPLGSTVASSNREGIHD